MLAVTGAKPLEIQSRMADPAEGRRQGGRCLELDALYAPKGTPQAIVDKLNAEVVKILNMPDVKERFAGGGVETIPSSAAELDARVKKAAARFKGVVEKANIKPD